MAKKLTMPSTSGILIQPKTEPPTREELMYAAGFTDGEGCISIIKQHVPGRRSPTYRLRLDLMQNCFRTLAVYVARVGVPAKVRPVKPHKSQNRQLWRVSYDGPQAYAAICNLRPFLERKRREAEVAIAFVERGRMSLHPGPKGTPDRIWKIREMCFRKLKKLK